MRFFVKIIIGVFFLGQSFSCLSNNYYVLTGRQTGLFSNILGVINHLIWCEKQGMDLVVYWKDEPSFYKMSDGYNGSDNIWEYYFYPVSEAHYQLGDELHADYTPPDGEAIECLYYLYEKNLSYEYRSFINSYIQRYIHIKPSILEKMNDFYKKNMEGKATIGIHVRRTDHYESPRIPLNAYIQVANSFKDVQFLVATDDQSVLDILKQKLKGNVIYYDAYRSSNNKGLHIWNPQVDNKALMGEQVLIESKLLSLCDCFIHSVSNVSLGALFFNPLLKSIYLKMTEDFKVGLVIS
ncbi:MAG: hypothetical protein AB7R69_01165 [Candidatus Babeliales bacterium]